MGAPEGGDGDGAPAGDLEVLRRRVINVVGHELRTPVTTLRGLTERLATAGGTELRDDLAPALVRLARRVELLLDDLLLAADVTTALPVGEPVAVAVADEVAAAWEALHADRPLAVDGDATALARPGALGRILGHVLDNAVKYGEGPVAVRIGGDGGVRVVVETAGPELSAADADLALEVFYRGERAVTTSPGFGVGLPVARTLARHEAGDLSFRPRAGGGAVTTIDLPAA